GQAARIADGARHRDRAGARQHLDRIGAAGAGRRRARRTREARRSAAAGSFRWWLYLGLGTRPLLKAAAKPPGFVACSLAARLPNPVCLAARSAAPRHAASRDAFSTRPLSATSAIQFSTFPFRDRRAATVRRRCRLLRKLPCR